MAHNGRIVLLLATGFFSVPFFSAGFSSQFAGLSQGDASGLLLTLRHYTSGLRFVTASARLRGLALAPTATHADRSRTQMWPGDGLASVTARWIVPSPYVRNARRPFHARRRRVV